MTTLHTSASYTELRYCINNETGSYVSEITKTDEREIQLKPYVGRSPVDTKGGKPDPCAEKAEVVPGAEKGLPACGTSK